MCKGRQLPVMYHWNGAHLLYLRQSNYPVSAGGGLGHGAAIRNEDHIACTWIGEGASAEPTSTTGCCSPPSTRRR
jgi:2-oxoisovalerate dehydrogenase E1 component alpha subunit